MFNTSCLSMFLVLEFVTYPPYFVFYFIQRQSWLLLLTIIMYLFDHEQIELSQNGNFQNVIAFEQIESVLCLSLRTFFKLFYFRWKKKMKQIQFNGINHFRKWEDVYMCVRDVDFACFYDFPIRFRNCSDSVVFSN
jgi:hypothetical protein